MNKILVVVALVIVGLVVGLVIYNNGSESDTSDNSASQQSSISFDDVQQSLREGAVLLDVRTPEEFNSGAFEGAENFNVELMKAGQFPELPTDTKLFVYCRSGNRSAEATELLRQQGYSDITDLGGLDDVINIGGELVFPQGTALPATAP
jgi:rhodanese-related sulfurtransferase